MGYTIAEVIAQSFAQRATYDACETLNYLTEANPSLSRTAIQRFALKLAEGEEYFPHGQVRSVHILRVVKMLGG